jgi:hypothetical protein
MIQHNEICRIDQNRTSIYLDQPEAFPVKTCYFPTLPSGFTRSHLKKVFSSDIGVELSSQILDILEYACGLILGLALISTENPNFDIASKDFYFFLICCVIILVPLMGVIPILLSFHGPK